jgi:hypothetical protein
MGSIVFLVLQKGSRMRESDVFDVFWLREYQAARSVAENFCFFVEVGHFVGI